MASVKVILCDDIDSVGNMGETVRVAPGYARNFLIPRKLAVLAESASARQIEHELKIIKKREDRKRTQLKEVAKVIETVTVDIQVRAGEGGLIQRSKPVPSSETSRVNPAASRLTPASRGR